MTDSAVVYLAIMAVALVLMAIAQVGLMVVALRAVKQLTATAEELISFVAARVAPHKKIRLVEFVEQIPKSPSGKILRRVLVAREREQRQGR